MSSTVARKAIYAFAGSSASWVFRTKLRRRPAPELELSPSTRTLQFATLASLTGLGGITWLLSGLSFAQTPHEAVWFGDRGFLSSERAMSFLPTGMCIGSGFVAATLQKLYPHHVRHLAISPRYHEMLALPLSLLLAFRSGFIAATLQKLYPHHVRHLAISPQYHKMLALPLSLLLAFRFQGSYERWWRSRINASDLMSRVAVIGEYIVANVPHKELKDLEPEKVEAQIEAEKIRARFLAILEAYIVLVEKQIHGDNFEPHPGNRVEGWPRPEDALKDWPEDAAACLAARDPVVWCSTTLLSFIQQLQELEIIDGDNGSMVGSQVMQMDQILSECVVVRVQETPAPFLVHYRTIMIGFCFTLPFSFIHVLSPWMMIPIQSTISFAFLGSEFCSRYMEHPFGADKDNIPLRKIVMETRGRLQQMRDMNL